MPILTLLPNLQMGGSPVAAALTHLQLKSLTLQLGGGIGTTLGLKGNTVPVSIVTTIPSAAPPGGSGVVFYVAGGSLTVYAWDADNTTWVS